MKRKMILEDDMKEYWGFYLLAGSIFRQICSIYLFYSLLSRVETCSRHEGASIVIVKGSKDAARCSWLGELDSQEESDELSNEFDYENEILDELPSQHKNNEDDTEEESEEIEDYDSAEIDELIRRNGILSGSSKEASKYLDNIEQWSVNSQKILVKKLMAKLKGKDDNNNDTIDLSISGHVKDNKAIEKQEETNELDKDNIDIENERATEDYEDYEGEEIFDDTDHMFNRGKFNQKNLPTDKEDKSDEEPNSSWSSSEEALEACEGVIHNNQLFGQKMCAENSTEEELQSAMKEFSYTVESSGRKIYKRKYKRMKF